MISNEDIFNLIKETQQEIKEELRSFRNEIKQEIDNLKEKNKKLESENLEIKKRLLNLERKSKKYNLVIHGLEDNGNTLIQDVKTLIQEKLNLENPIEYIRDAYRIGKKINSNPRPVAVELFTYQQKIKILQNAKRLKGSGVYITQEHTSEDYQKIKYLNEHLKAAKKKQYDAKIRNYMLIINGEKYTYEHLKEKEEENLEGQITEKSASVPTTPKPDLETAFSFKGPRLESSKGDLDEPETTTAVDPKSTEQALEIEERKRKLDITPTKETGTKSKISNRNKSTSRNRK